MQPTAVTLVAVTAAFAGYVASDLRNASPADAGTGEARILRSIDKSLKGSYGETAFQRLDSIQKSLRTSTGTNAYNQLYAICLNTRTSVACPR